MGTQHIDMTRGRRSPKHMSFRRLFIWYCIGILAVIFVITCTLAFLLLSWIESDASINTILYAHNTFLRILPITIFMTLPVVVLIAAILFFAWLMGRKISRPVSELMRAVEKIRQQDLNFVINYSARNE